MKKPGRARLVISMRPEWFSPHLEFPISTFGEHAPQKRRASRSGQHWKTWKMGWCEERFCRSRARCGFGGLLAGALAILRSRAFMIAIICSFDSGISFAATVSCKCHCIRTGPWKENDVDRGYVSGPGNRHTCLHPTFGFIQRAVHVDIVDGWKTIGYIWAACVYPTFRILVDQLQHPWTV